MCESVCVYVLSISPPFFYAIYSPFFFISFISLFLFSFSNNGMKQAAYTIFPLSSSFSFFSFFLSLFLSYYDVYWVGYVEIMLAFLRCGILVFFFFLFKCCDLLRRYVRTHCQVSFQFSLLRSVCIEWWWCVCEYACVVNKSIKVSFFRLS